MAHHSSTVRLDMDYRNITTAFELPGYRVVQSLGVVRGIVVRSRSVFGSIGASLQTLRGGNISYVERDVRDSTPGGLRTDGAACRCIGRECLDRDALRCE